MLRNEEPVGEEVEDGAAAVPQQSVCDKEQPKFSLDCESSVCSFPCSSWWGMRVCCVPSVGGPFAHQDDGCAGGLPCICCAVLLTTCVIVWCSHGLVPLFSGFVVGVVWWLETWCLSFCTHARHCPRFVSFLVLFGSLLVLFVRVFCIVCIACTCALCVCFVFACACVLCLQSCAGACVYERVRCFALTCAYV